MTTAAATHAPGGVAARPVSRRRALLIVALAALTGNLAIVLVWQTQNKLVEVAWDLVVAAGWAAVGWLACLLRPKRRIGQLMLAFAALLAAVGPAGFGLHYYGWLSSAIITVSYALVPFQIPLGGHLLLAFPSGRLSERSHRRLIAVAYGYAGIESIGLLLTLPRQSGQCGNRCAENLANLIADSSIHATVTSISAAGWLPLTGWFVFLAIRRYRRAGRRQRRVLAPPFAGTAAVIVAFLYLVGYGAIHGVNVIGAGPSPTTAGIRTAQIALLAVPGCFMLGLLRERLAYSGVSDMLRDLGTQADPAQPDMSSALARTLGDPTLQVAFPMGEQLVDINGRPVTPPGDRTRSTTPVGDASQPLAVLIHDPTLDDEPELLVAAGSAARLALDNARLHAEVIAQLAEVRASRSRIIAAADEARRRLERDLHDGAQQRLLAIGLALQLLRTRLTDNNAAAELELLTEAENELTGALQELRELAAGIHPAILTDQGLRPALLTLASRCRIPLTVLGEDPRRLPEPVESTAYFCTTEAVTNAVKHAHATTITIVMHRTADMLTLTVSDDGVGGADPTGSGLRGLADRVAALDGQLTIDSPHGCGTRLRIELPCG
ncbi:MAG: sensor histidine kinase [Actinomycetota bacterium]|nr:sensor histidine kinase [Actinomycetota bacterium]